LRGAALIKINPASTKLFHMTLEMSERHHSPDQWLPISIAPEDCDLQVGAIDKNGVGAWAFPCRKRNDLWFNAWHDEPVLICPTHWRIWRR
jgi:hypothetical protein